MGLWNWIINKKINDLEKENTILKGQAEKRKTTIKELLITINVLRRKLDAAQAKLKECQEKIINLPS